MKKLLRSKANFDILEGFLSELLKDNIKIIAILESESNKNTVKDKFNRVDIKVKNQHDEIILIEIQYDRELDYFQRIIYGTSKAITEHIDEPQPYSSVIKVISINIIYFDIGHGSDYIYHGKTVFKGLHNNDTLNLSDGQKKIFDIHEIHNIFPEYYLIKINNFNDIAKDSLDEWIYFLKNGDIQERFNAKGIKKAKKALDVLKLSEKERMAYEKYVDDLHYQASMYESTYKYGRVEGREEGREEGIQEGIEKGKNETALQMLRMNLDIDLIIKITGLTKEKILKLSSDK
jgi:predicted transposase/invertase (TIGR01784 family)